MTLAATILKQDLKQFCGTDRYYYDPLFKNINYTDGFRYFMHNAGEGAHWFLTLVSTEIRPILEEDFYFIELVVNADETAKITVQRDIGEPVLYEKELDYTDCPPSDEPYKFYFDCNKDISILFLPSEY